MAARQELDRRREMRRRYNFQFAELEFMLVRCNLSGSWYLISSRQIPLGILTCNQSLRWWWLSYDRISLSFYDLITKSSTTVDLESLWWLPAKSCDFKMHISWYWCLMTCRRIIYRNVSSFTEIVLSERLRKSGSGPEVWALKNAKPKKLLQEWRSSFCAKRQLAKIRMM